MGARPRPARHRDGALHRLAGWLVRGGPRLSPARVAVVGVGGIANTWLPLLAESGLTEVVGAVDVAPAAAEARLAEHGIDAPVFAELDAALAALELDAVVSLTPPDVHRAVAEAALAAGLHIVTEKPLATTLADGRAVGTATGA